jgi:acyl carrier protein
MEIVMYSMEEVGVKLPLIELAQVKDINGLVTLLCEQNNVCYLDKL